MKYLSFIIENKSLNYRCISNPEFVRSFIHSNKDRRNVCVSVYEFNVYFLFISRAVGR